MKQMLKAQKRIDFAIFTFAQSSGIDDTMLSLARGGMTIRGVLDPGQAAQHWAAPKTMNHPNIQLFVPQRTGVFKDLRKRFDNEKLAEALERRIAEHADVVFFRRKQPPSTTNTANP